MRSMRGVPEVYRVEPRQAGGQGGGAGRQRAGRPPPQRKDGAAGGGEPGGGEQLQVQEPMRDRGLSQQRSAAQLPGLLFRGRCCGGARHVPFRQRSAPCAQACILSFTCVRQPSARWTATTRARTRRTRAWATSTWRRGLHLCRCKDALHVHSAHCAANGRVWVWSAGAGRSQDSSQDAGCCVRCCGRASWRGTSALETLCRVLAPPAVPDTYLDASLSRVYKSNGGRSKGQGTSDARTCRSGS
jgi:hypothetical protein